MLPPEPRLEVRKRLPTNASRKPSLVFVHGGYCDAWFWEPYFLPWFANRGYAAYALSLCAATARAAAAIRCSSPGSTITRPTSSTWFGTLDRPPVLIGHSMGAAVVERIVAKRPVRGAALIAPVPPSVCCRSPPPCRLPSRLSDPYGRRGPYPPVRRRAAGLAAVLFQLRGPAKDPRAKQPVT